MPTVRTIIKFMSLIMSLAGAGLTGCSVVQTESGQTENTPQARMCAKALEMAKENIDLAHGMNGSGELTVMHASHVYSSAKWSQYRRNYQDCVDKATRAQNLVREAYRTNARQE